MALTYYCKIATLLAGTLLGMTMGCQPTPPIPVLTAPDGSVLQPPPKPAEADEVEARSWANEAQNLRAKGLLEAAYTRETELLKSHPGTLAAADIMYRRAGEAKQSGELSRAARYYEQLLFYRPAYEKIDEVRMGYSETLLGTRRYQDAANMLGPLYVGLETGRRKTIVGAMYIRALHELDRPAEALEVCADLHALVGLARDDRTALEELALDVVSGRLSFSQVEHLWDRYQNNPSWSFILPALGYKLAKIYYHTRNYDRSRQLLDVVMGKFPTNHFGREAALFQARLKARFQVEANTLGVMLPLSGRYKQFGQRALEAIRIAVSKNPSIRLIVKDTQGSPTAASKAVEDLVLKDHVLAVIGPLFSKAATAAALKAEELSVPIITLSHREGIADTGPYVFRSALTVKMQAEALAKVAFENLGMSRFGMLYPRSRYGTEFAKAFWDEVDRRKGEIRGIESYEHDETTFQEPVRKLVGRWYRNSRPDYQEKLKAILDKDLPSHRARAAIDKMQKNLPPIVDFDAIVIPDSGRNLGLIAPALAFEDIVMTRNERALDRIRKATGNKNVHPITLLGASTWNSPQLLRSCTRYCEDSIFVDGYFRDNPSPLVRDFDSAFREAQGTAPNLSDAQAHDTAALLKLLLETKRPSSREELRRLLVSKFKFQGVTGPLHFNENGEAVRDLFVLTVREGAIQKHEPIEPPSEG